MAAPPEVTIKDLTGKWQMDKTLSDDFDPILALQGMGWLTRKAIGLATVTQSIKHYSSSPSSSSSAGAKGTVHIDTEQTVTGGISASPEYRVLDWQERAHSDRIFGELVGRSRYVDPRALPDAELSADKDWLAGGWDEEGEKVESLVENRAAGWTAVQIWGFAVVEGKRRHVRKVVIMKGSERRRARFVYNYIGKLE